MILKKQNGKFTFGDNASGNILGKGVMNLGKDKDKNVLLVENLKPRLLSVSQTCDQGHICKLILKNVKLGETTQENWLVLLLELLRMYTY